MHQLGAANSEASWCAKPALDMGELTSCESDYPGRTQVKRLTILFLKKNRKWGFLCEISWLLHVDKESTFPET